MNKEVVNKLMGELGDLLSDVVLTKKQADKIRAVFIELAIAVNIDSAKKRKSHCTNNAKRA